jgi:hypothetical protein
VTLAEVLALVCGLLWAVLWCLVGSAFTWWAGLVINRHGRPCGLFFEVAGTRLMRSYAVWAGEETRILFYGNSGERFAEVRLSEAPDPLRLAG